VLGDTHAAGGGDGLAGRVEADGHQAADGQALGQPGAVTPAESEVQRVGDQQPDDGDREEQRAGAR
jgi:hypothetical protein